MSMDVYGRCVGCDFSNDSYCLKHKKWAHLIRDCKTDICAEKNKKYVEITTKEKKFTNDELIQALKRFAKKHNLSKFPKYSEIKHLNPIMIKGQEVTMYNFREKLRTQLGVSNINNIMGWENGRICDKD